MRQVPTFKYLIIGNGRTAQHMRFYLAHLGHSIEDWHYTTHSSDQLKSLAAWSDRTLILIKDSVMEEFVENFSFLRNSKTIHFSGALDIPGLANAHPLISFSHDLFDLEFYKRIPFAIFGADPIALTTLLPGLPNPSFIIPKNQKALYHGLCVTSGNFTVLLWQIIGKTFLENLGVTSTQLIPYLESVTSNLKTQWDNALTGPIARRDSKTLLKNYSAIKDTSLKELFEAHVRIAWPEFSSEHFDPK